MEEIASNFNNLNLNLFSYFKNNSAVKSESVTPSLHLSIEIQTSSKKPVLLDKIRPQQLPTNRFEFRQRLNGTQRIKSHRLPTSQLPAYFYLSSSAPQLKANSNNNFNRQSHHQYYSSIHDQQPPLAPIATGYKSGNNELYSIFISMFTAAVFLIFIMWRWIRLKSDLRQALREQNEIEREMRLNGSSGSSPPNSLTCTGVNSPRFDINAFRCSYNRVNNPNLEMRRQRLEALINQLSSSPNRDSYHNRQILATAKYCLHQLRMQAQRERTAAERDYLSGYFSYGQRYDRSLFDSGHGGGGSSSTSPTTTPSSITPLNRAPYSASSFGINATTSSSSTPQQQLHYHLHHSSGVNESPPSYESLMTKSSSLPSYCHLSNVNDISSHGSKDDSIDRSK